MTACEVLWKDDHLVQDAENGKLQTYVGQKMRLYFSWHTPDRPRPVRVVKEMLTFYDLSHTDDISKCSYLKFEDSDMVEPVHRYRLIHKV